MKSQIRVIKQRRNNISDDQSIRVEGKTERQRDREMAGIIKGWVNELELRKTRRLRAALGQRK
jgi:hypothetical protein